MKRALLILVCLGFVGSIWAYLSPDTPLPSGADSLVLRAPVLRAALDTNLLDSIIVRDQDDNIIEATYYDRDATGRIIRPTVIRYDHGVPTDASVRTETAYRDTAQVLYATYTWSTMLSRWVGQKRIETIYDDEWRRTNVITYGWNPAYQYWTPVSSMQYLNFVSRTQPSDCIAYAINDTTYSLELDTMSHREWDEDGHLVLHIFYSGQTDGVWGAPGSVKRVYAYKANKQTLEEVYLWDTPTNTWVGQSRHVWDFDEWGNTILEEQYNAMVNGVWQGKSKQVSSYDSKKHRLLYEVYSSWQDGEWIGSTREEQAYDGNTRILIVKYSGWRDHAFIPQTKDTVGLKDGRTVLTASYKWVTDHWEGTKQEVTEYNGSTKILVIKYSGWSNNDFIPVSKDTTGLLNGKTVLTASYKWVTDHWEGTKQEKTVYDGNNKVSVVKSSTWADGDFVPQTKDSTLYNASNKVTFSVHYLYSDTATWEGDMSKSNYSQTYTASGQLDWKTDLQWVDHAWKDFLRTQSIYNGGNLVEENTQQFNGTDWVAVKKVTHTWQDGVEIFTRTEEWDATAGKLKMTSQVKHVVEKNSAGKKIDEYTMSCGVDSVWVGYGYTRNTWEYDEFGNEIASAKYSWRNNDWGEDWTTSNIYLNGNSAKPLYKDRWVWDNASKRMNGSYKNEYAYDENLRQIMSKSWTWRSGDWYGSTYSETSFNDQGLADTVTNYSYYQRNWVGATKHAYTYYEDKSLHEDTKYDYNRDGRYWMPSSKDEYLYFNGISSGTRNYEYLQGAWVPTYADEYYYDANPSQKLREEIHGTWSKGILTSYRRVVYYYRDDH